MKFLLLIYLEETILSDTDREACYVESTQLAQDLCAKGQYLTASPLQPVATASSLRIRGGKQHVTDGPFAETREQLGGYFMVEAKDKEEALTIAARIPAARFGTVEVRPVIELPGLPDGAEAQRTTSVPA